jgi:hypothetical protein
MQERDRVLIEEALHGMDLGLVPNNVAHVCLGLYVDCEERIFIC